MYTQWPRSFMHRNKWQNTYICILKYFELSWLRVCFYSLKSIIHVDIVHRTVYWRLYHWNGSQEYRKRIGSPVLSSTSGTSRDLSPVRSSGCFMTQARRACAITGCYSSAESSPGLDTPLPHHLDVAVAANWMPLEVNLLACGNRFHLLYHQAGGSDCFICKFGRKNASKMCYDQL